MTAADPVIHRSGYGVCRRLGRVLPALLAVAGCAGTGPISTGANPASKAVYRGFMEVIARSGDVQPICASTVSLRNDSGDRQGEARLRIDWLDEKGSVLEQHELLMIKTKPGQVTAKNLVVELPCDRVHRIRMRSAEWVLGWDIRSTTVVPITDVDGAELPLDRKAHV